MGDFGVPLGRAAKGSTLGGKQCARFLEFDSGSFLM